MVLLLVVAVGSNYALFFEQQRFEQRRVLDFLERDDVRGARGGYDLAGVSPPEFGHAVGLGHSNVGGATMYPSAAACDFSLSSLANDDKAGYSAIYSGCR